MNLKRRLLTLTGTLLLVAAFTQAVIGAEGNTVGFEVVSETPGSTTTRAPTEYTPATVTWQGDDRMVITTVGYPNCPVLPASITTAGDVVSIDLTAVPGESDCGTSLKFFTTVVHLEDWDEDQSHQLEVRGQER